VLVILTFSTAAAAVTATAASGSGTGQLFELWIVTDDVESAGQIP